MRLKTTKWLSTVSDNHISLLEVVWESKFNKKEGQRKKMKKPKWNNTDVMLGATVKRVRRVWMKTHKEFMRKSLLCTLISKLLHIFWPSSAKKKTLKTHQIYLPRTTVCLTPMSLLYSNLEYLIINGADAQIKLTISRVRFCDVYV